MAERLASAGARLALAALVAATLAGCGEQSSREPAKAPAETSEAESKPPVAALPEGKGFDFYVLSLSWSPTWCAENDAAGRTEQCRRGNRHGFIVHGLWPQYDRGYPDFCPSRQPDRVPEALGRSVMDIIPSMGLIGHQWRKHGTCSGLSQKDYFAVTRAARDRIVLPEALEDAQTTQRTSPEDIEKSLIAANPGLTQEGLAVTCRDGRLEEVRICLTRDLSFRECPEVDRDACRADSITRPPIR
ncbi:MAG: ribonuclease [Shinella sp.]|nr:ribonuclease [Shinella sp.]